MYHTLPVAFNFLRVSMGNTESQAKDERSTAEIIEERCLYLVRHNRLCMIGVVSGEEGAESRFRVLIVDSVDGEKHYDSSDARADVAAVVIKLMHHMPVNSYYAPRNARGPFACVILPKIEAVTLEVCQHGPACHTLKMGGVVYQMSVPGVTIDNKPLEYVSEILTALARWRSETLIRTMAAVST
jgi:hypothetical protein